MLEVKMAGYWPSSFFACLWPKTETGRRINVTLFCCFRHNFVCGTQRVVWSGEYSAILWARVASHSTGFWFLLPAHRASHIIKSISQTRRDRYRLHAVFIVALSLSQLWRHIYSRQTRTSFIPRAKIVNRKYRFANSSAEKVTFLATMF